MNTITVTNKPPLSNSINLRPNPTTLRLHPPEFLHLRLLKSCTHLLHFKQIHTQFIKIPSDQPGFLLTKLVDSLVSTSHMDYAHRVFDQMSEPTTFVFNTMIRGYALAGLPDQAIQFYNLMQYRGLESDNFTYPFLLKACKSLNHGKGVHSLLLKTRGFDVYSQTSLVSFYSSYGDLEYARSVFDRMQERNVVSWTAMITGNVKQKRYSEGLALFHTMQAEGIEINELTLANVLSACAHLGAFEMGKWVHGYIDKN